MSLKNAINNWQNAPLNQHRGVPMRRQLPDEESFFNAMIDYFNNKPFASVINAQKTHGRKHQISYKPISPYYGTQGWGTEVKKEISDVFFVVFSIKEQMARMTHLQAKYERSRGLNPQANNFVFSLDDGQYLMLHNRLYLKKSGIFPNDIFSFKLYSDSIASYGVFYRDPNGINMAYEVAPLISYPGRTAYTSKRATDEHSFALTQDVWGYTNIKSPHESLLCHCYYCGSCQELLSTIDIDIFEQELLNLHVGTRVDFDINTLQKLVPVFAGNNAVSHGFGAFVDQQRGLFVNTSFNRHVESLHEKEDDDMPPQRDEAHSIEDGGTTCILINADEARRMEL